MPNLERLPANVALMHAVREAAEPHDVEVRLRKTAEDCLAAGDRAAARRLRDALELWRSAPEAWSTLRSILAEADACPGGAVDHWAALFDKAVAISPAASVALYSLGRTEILDAATAEILGMMAGLDLLGPGRTLIEIGCGIGRFLPGIAATGARVFGIDVSAGMLAEAARRHAGRVARSSGRDLACIAGACADTVYAVDSFPYLVDAGVVEEHLADIRRVLKPRGTLLVLNWSYRDADEDVPALSKRFGLALVENDSASLRHWDGRVFRLQRSSS